MFLIYDDTYQISDKSTGAIAHIEPPCVIEDGKEQALSPVSQNGDTWHYQGAFDRVTVSVKHQKNGLFYIKRIWGNTAPHARNIKTVFRVAACFDVQKFLIPCVSINGNPFGAGKEPKGLERNSKKWVFAYDRVSIPACTLTENADHALSLFASGESERSLALQKFETALAVESTASADADLEKSTDVSLNGEIANPTRSPILPAICL